MPEKHPDAPLPEEDNSQTAQTASEWLQADRRKISRRLKFPRIHNPFKDLDLPPSENTPEKRLKEIGRRPLVITLGLTLLGGLGILGVRKLMLDGEKPNPKDPIFSPEEVGKILTYQEMTKKDFDPSKLQNISITIPHTTATKSNQNISVLFDELYLGIKGQNVYTAIMYDLTDDTSGNMFPYRACLKAYANPATDPPITTDTVSQNSAYSGVGFHGKFKENKNEGSAGLTGHWIFVIDGFVPKLPDNLGK